MCVRENGKSIYFRWYISIFVLFLYAYKLIYVEERTCLRETDAGPGIKDSTMACLWYRVSLLSCSSHPLNDYIPLLINFSVFVFLPSLPSLLLSGHRSFWALWKAGHPAHPHAVRGSKELPCACPDSVGCPKRTAPGRAHQSSGSRSLRSAHRGPDSVSRHGGGSVTRPPSRQQLGYEGVGDSSRTSLSLGRAVWGLRACAGRELLHVMYK